MAAGAESELVLPKRLGRCRACGHRLREMYAGMCGPCLFRGWKSLYALTSPLTRVLVRHGLLKKGDVMPYNAELEDLLERLADGSKKAVPGGLEPQAQDKMDRAGEAAVLLAPGQLQLPGIRGGAQEPPPGQVPAAGELRPGVPPGAPPGPDKGGH